MKQWVNNFAPVYTLPTDTSAKVLDIPEKSVVDVIDARMGFSLVAYSTGYKNFTGWMPSYFLEDYIENLPKDCIEFPDQTPDPRDAEQFFYWLGIKQVNICGEACASYVLNVKLKELLPFWRDHKPSIWRYVFSNNFFRGTGDNELISIFSAYAQQAIKLSTAIKNETLYKYTVTGLKNLLANGDVIASVHINNAGRLKYSGALHWIVVTGVFPERTGYGRVQLFNPYPNRIEEYSWDEFIISAGNPYGVFISK